MSRRKKSLFVFLVLVLVMMVPLAAEAATVRLKAILSAQAQADGVMAQAHGIAFFNVEADVIHYKLEVHDLSKLFAHVVIDIDGVEILVLCGDDDSKEDPKAASGKCHFEDGVLKVEGLITADLLAKVGLTMDQFIALLLSGKAHVSVYTDLNLAAEARGKIVVYVSAL